MLHNCNLVPEFNGLVSKRVNRKIGPFYFLINLFSNYFFLKNIYRISLLAFHKFFSFLSKYFFNLKITDAFENLTLFYE